MCVCVGVWRRVRRSRGFGSGGFQVVFILKMDSRCCAVAAALVKVKLSYFTPLCFQANRLDNIGALVLSFCLLHCFFLRHKAQHIFNAHFCVTSSTVNSMLAKVFIFLISVKVWHTGRREKNDLMPLLE